MTPLATYRAPSCTLYRLRDHVLTVHADGSTTANWPPSSASFAATAQECGFADLMDYVWEHELCHALVPLELFGEPSYVSRMAALNEPLDPTAAAAEERLVYYVQRYIAGAMPCFDPQWGAVRDEILAVRAEVAKGLGR